MKTRVIHTKFWKDGYVAKLNRAEKIVFIYLLTNENVSMSGIYELNDLEIKTWLGITDTELEEAKKKLQSGGKVFFKDGWVCLKNHNKYNSYGRGEKQAAALVKERSLIPKEIQDYFDTSMDTSIGGVSILDLNPKSETLNPKSESLKGLDSINSFFLKETSAAFPGLNVLEEWETAKDWLASKGQVRKDYRAFFRNWLRRANKDLKGGVSRGEYKSRNQPAKGKYDKFSKR